VKYTYGLWVTEAEQNAMVSVLSGCPTQPLPEGSAVPEAPTPEPEPTPEPTTAAPAAPVAPAPAAPEPTPVPEPAVPAPAAVEPAQPANWSYKNCTEARAAGAAPVMRGTPGYGAHLDRDDDGIGCE
jgi:Excalibur calcium-binding domain